MCDLLSALCLSSGPTNIATHTTAIATVSHQPFDPPADDQAQGTQGNESLQKAEQQPSIEGAPQTPGDGNQNRTRWFQIRTSCTTERLSKLHGWWLHPDPATRGSYMNGLASSTFVVVTLRYLFCKDTQAWCWILEMQKEHEAPLAVARLCSNSYPAADHRYQLLHSDDMGFKNVLTTHPFENVARLGVKRIHPHLLMIQWQEARKEIREIAASNATHKSFHEDQQRCIEELKQKSEEQAVTNTVVFESHQELAGAFKDLSAEFATTANNQIKLNNELTDKIKQLESNVSKQERDPERRRHRSRSRSQTKCDRCRERPMRASDVLHNNQQVLVKDGKDHHVMYAVCDPSVRGPRRPRGAHYLCSDKSMRPGTVRSCYHTRSITIIEKCARCAGGERKSR